MHYSILMMRGLVEQEILQFSSLQRFLINLLLYFSKTFTLAVVKDTLLVFKMNFNFGLYTYF